MIDGLKNMILTIQKESRCDAAVLIELIQKYSYSLYTATSIWYESAVRNGDHSKIFRSRPELLADRAISESLATSSGIFRTIPYPEPSMLIPDPSSVLRYTMLVSSCHYLMGREWNVSEINENLLNIDNPVRLKGNPLLSAYEIGNETEFVSYKLTEEDLIEKRGKPREPSPEEIKLADSYLAIPSGKIYPEYMREFFQMKDEKRMLYACHPACCNREYRHGCSIRCRAGYDNRQNGIASEYLYCPPPMDYYDHMDTYCAELKTERGIVRLKLKSGEPAYIEPAFHKYIAWLHKRRRSVAVLQNPINERDIEYYVDKHLTTESICAEFLLTDDEMKMLDRASEASFHDFESSLPEQVRDSSREYEAAVMAKSQVKYPYKLGELIGSKEEAATWSAACKRKEEVKKNLRDSITDAIERRLISRDDAIRLRNHHFHGWG